MKTKRTKQAEKKEAVAQLQKLEAKMAAWMEDKGERLTDEEVRKLCDLRREFVGNARG